jgi:hypothetical protein
VQSAGRSDLAEYVAERRTRRRHGVGIAVALAAMLFVIAATGAGARQWFRGGTFLDAAGAGYGGPAAVGEGFSFGIDLATASGPSVVLDHVSAKSSAGSEISWSIYRTPPGGLGFGSVTGPLAPQWPTRPVDEYRVAQPRNEPERGATWLVATVVAPRPGVYRVDGITISYHSGRRNRTTSANAWACVLVYADGQRQAILHAIDTFEPDVTNPESGDPLVAEYERCQDPTLTS